MLTTLQIIDLSLYLLVAALYLPVIVNALRGQEGHQTVHYLLGLYAFLGLLLGVGEALWRSSLTVLSVNTFLVYQTYAALILSVLMLLVVSIFLRRQGWPWLVVAGVLVVLLLTSARNVFGLPTTILTSGRWSLPRDDLPFFLILLGWLIFVISGLAAVRTAYRHAKQPLYRNRLAYWLPFFFLIIVNDVFIFVRIPLPGNPLRLASAWLMGYIVLTHDIPDARQLVRRMLIYIITTLLIVVFYIAGFTL